MEFAVISSSNTIIVIIQPSPMKFRHSFISSRCDGEIWFPVGHVKLCETSAKIDAACDHKHQRAHTTISAKSSRNHRPPA